MTKRITLERQIVIWWDGPGYYATIPRTTPAGEAQLMRLSTATNPAGEARTRGWTDLHWRNTPAGGPPCPTSD